MSIRDEVSAMINDIRTKHALWKDRVITAAQNRVQKFTTDVYQEFGEYQREKISEIFNKAISTFYNAYQPTVYQRTHSLYDLLQLPIDDRGLVDFEDAMDLVDRTKIHPDRFGGSSLFDTVFLEGWHGGAKTFSPDKSAVWGTHPDSGVPYYRTRGNVTYPDTGITKRHRYGKWGKMAFRSQSPYQLFSTQLQIDDDGVMYEKFREIADRHWESASQKIQDDVNAIGREIYG